MNWKEFILKLTLFILVFIVTTIITAFITYNLLKWWLG